MLVVAGMAAVVVRAFARTEERTERFGRLARVLVVAQTRAFAAQEVLERLVSGAPLGGLAHDHILVTGIAVQIVVAMRRGGDTCGCSPGRPRVSRPWPRPAPAAPRPRGVRPAGHGTTTPRPAVRHGGQRSSTTLLLTSPRRAHPRARPRTPCRSVGGLIMWERSKRPLSAAALVRGVRAALGGTRLRARVAQARPPRDGGGVGEPNPRSRVKLVNSISCSWSTTADAVVDLGDTLDLEVTFGEKTTPLTLQEPFFREGEGTPGDLPRVVHPDQRRAVRSTSPGPSTARMWTRPSRRVPTRSTTSRPAVGRVPRPAADER